MLSSQDNALLTQVGPRTPMGDMLRRFWTPFLETSKLPGPDCDPVEVRILGEDLVAYRDTQGRYGLLVNKCPHRGTPLYYGRNEENGIRCIYHGWKFDIEGRCVDMPSEPAASNFKQKVKVGAYPVHEMAGVLWTYMGPNHLMPDMPDLAWSRTTEGQRNIVRYNQECNWVQALEGDIDTSHTSFLHRGSLSKEPGYVDIDYACLMFDPAPRVLVKDTEYGMMTASQRNTESGDGYYYRINQWLLPYITLIGTDLGLTHVHGHMWVPIDDEHTDVWCIYWSNDDLPIEERLSILGGSEPHIATLDWVTGRLRATKENHFLQNRNIQRTKDFTGILGVREQDTAVVEGMGAIVDRTREHLGTSDAAIIAMRRKLIRIAKALRELGDEPYGANHPDVYRVRSWSAILDKNIPFDENPRVRELNSAVPIEDTVQ